MESQGRPKALTNDDLAILERFIDLEGFDARVTPLAAMPAAAGLDLDPPPSGRTIVLQHPVDCAEIKVRVMLNKLFSDSPNGVPFW
ncbi:hypothetical protein DHEL01_v212822 [Diaporthe helianthi]|uniref:Uncharacterized protein n=1 Tax=Diaporthe helianthi TaxID=158607 RepID=A0A2P5HEW3_DIAHE|nr:hypothetical protein DHEL01_v212822 [Diaporthe helianthi]